MKLMLLKLSLLNIPEYAWMCLYKQDFEYGRVLNMLALKSVLDMPEYVLTEFWIYLGF